MTEKPLRIIASDLFGAASSDNLLPYDGTVHYYGPILDAAQAEFYHEKLLHDLPWKNDEAVIYGRHIITARKVVWVGNTDYAYTYSGTTRQAIPWTPEVLELKRIVENLTQTNFNSCLLNLYPTGKEGMSWHSDDEKSLGKDTPIASLSFGAERRFCFRHKKTRQTIEHNLESGSLLMMAGTTQTHWLHSLPKAMRVQTPRINLTFRVMRFSGNAQA